MKKHNNITEDLMKKDKHPVIIKEAEVSDISFKDAVASESIDSEQSIVGWGSRPTIDRDKELIESSAWKLDNYRKNPVLLLCHKYDAPPVGKVLWVKADQNGLKFKAKFANTERGKECYALYKDGIMNAFSVGFKPRQGGVIDNPTDVKYKGCRRVFTDVELMEISCVPVPANSDALVEHVKSGKIHTKQLQDELEFVLDIVDKAPSCPAEGGKFGTSFNTLDECKTCELREACKASAPKTEEEKSEDDVIEKVEVSENYVHVPTSKADHSDHKIRTISVSKKEGIEAVYCIDCKTITSYMFDKEKWSKDKAVTWVADHKKDFIGNYHSESDTATFGIAKEVEYIDDDGDAVFTKEEDSIDDDKKKIEELESIIKSLEAQIAEEKTPTTSEHKDIPSLYELASSVDVVLNSDSEQENRKSVIDVFIETLTEKSFSGHVVYSGKDQEDSAKYFKVGYSYDLETSEVSLSEEPAEVSQSWVTEKYFIDIDTKDDDIGQKSGRMISSKNKTLLSDCASKMKAAVEAIETLISSDEKEDEDVEDEKEFIEIIEKEHDTFEIEDDDSSNDTFEIDEDTIKKAVAGAVSANAIQVDTKGIVEEIVAKLKGKATL